MKESAKLMGLTAAWWIFIALLVGAVSIVGLIIRPYILDLQNNQNQHSYEYVTSVKEMLINDYVEWKALDAEIKTLSDQNVIAAKRANQAAIVVEMRKKAMRINQNEVPVEVAQFLSGR